MPAYVLYENSTYPVNYNAKILYIYEAYTIFNVCIWMHRNLFHHGGDYWQPGPMDISVTSGF